MTVEVLLQGIIGGLLMGCIYALIAAGLSLIFCLMEIVNFAHGEFLMLAMFSTFWAWSLWRLDPLISPPPFPPAPSGGAPPPPPAPPLTPQPPVGSGAPHCGPKSPPPRAGGPRGSS